MTYYIFPDTAWEQAMAYLKDQSGSQCSQVGLYDHTDDVEYGLWVLMGEAMDPPISVESIGVTNVSRTAGKNIAQFTPCAIFVVGPPPPSSLQVNGVRFDSEWLSNPMGVFLPLR